MVHNGLGLQGGFHLISKGDTFGGQIGLSINIGKNFCRLTQRAHGHEVGRDKEIQDGAVVGRTEGRCDEPAGLQGGTVTVPALGVELAVRLAEEAVLSEAVILLLFPHYAKDCLHGFQPKVSEYRCVPGLLPIAISKSNRIALRVQFPLALENVRYHIGSVFMPAVIRRAWVESVGVRVYHKALDLAEDCALYHFCKGRILIRQLHIVPHLRPRVTEPHGRDVAGPNECVWRAVFVL